METRVRLSKRRQKTGQQPNNTRLVVRHRPLNANEFRMQRYREKQLEPPNEDDEEEEEEDDNNDGEQQSEHQEGTTKETSETRTNEEPGKIICFTPKKFYYKPIFFHKITINLFFIIYR